MQGSIHRFDDATGEGSLLLDDGRELTFSGEVFEASGLRHVRPGQRVSVEADGRTATRVWIVGIGAGEVIG